MDRVEKIESIVNRIVELPESDQESLAWALSIIPKPDDEQGSTPTEYSSIDWSVLND